MTRKRTSNLMKRVSTLRYEVARDLTPDPRALTEEEIQLRNSILCNDGICEYCRKRESSRAWGDHLYPIIDKKYPSVYCSDDWNRIPACATCNSSKGGRTWKEWFASSNASNPLREATEEERRVIEDKFTRYDEAMQKYCQRKIIEQQFFDNLMTRLSHALQIVDDDIRSFHTNAAIAQCSMRI